MLTDEWNWDEYMEVALEEAREKGLELGIGQGIEQGIEQGRESEKIMIADNLLKIGMSVEEIALVTKLPVERIRAM
jgi:predicted transposase/invertase (TIGR01784 family)